MERLKMQEKNTVAKENVRKMQEAAAGEKLAEASGITALLPCCAEGLWISRKRSLDNFVLVRLLDASSYSAIHYVAIRGQVLQMEVFYVQNACEREQLQKRRKLIAGGLFVELEPVSAAEYRRYERVAGRHLKTIMIKGK